MHIARLLASADVAGCIPWVCLIFYYTLYALAQSNCNAWQLSVCYVVWMVTLYFSGKRVSCHFTSSLYAHVEWQWCWCAAPFEEYCICVYAICMHIKWWETMFNRVTLFNLLKSSSPRATRDIRRKSESKIKQQQRKNRRRIMKEKKNIRYETYTQTATIHAHMLRDWSHNLW